MIDLHGRYDRVICLSCLRVISREHLAERLTVLNPHLLERVGDLDAAAALLDAGVTETLEALADRL